MLTYKQILELIDKLVDTPLSEISVNQGDFSMSLKKETTSTSSGVVTSFVGAPINYPPMGQMPAPSPAAAPQAPVVSNLIEVTSPMVGTFYAAPSPDSPSFVSVGQAVKPNDVLCIIEAMKVMNEFPSEVSGTVEEICVKNGQTVEYGQVLFRLKP
jgi:acetyl-CoA carboxylase biotin carboxyl carrier protein